ncbi:MAG: L-histidine N(alpha)-methyltransferase [Bryobacterales bacterium]|nr:L-histidine N(alpha)-methyltransferase [Bryobacterales bacterium]
MGPQICIGTSMGKNSRSRGRDSLAWIEVIECGVKRKLRSAVTQNVWVRLHCCPVAEDRKEDKAIFPEYYPTRTARDILSTYAQVIITATSSDYSRPLRLLELGAGTAAKTGILLEATTRLRNKVIYFPVDVSPDALDAACDSIGCLLPDVRLQPMVANYVTHPPKLERFKGPRSRCTSVRASATSRRRGSHHSSQSKV